MSDFEPIKPGEGNIAKRIQEKRKKVEAHQRAVRERASEAKHVKAIYQDTVHDELLADLIRKGNSFVDYHLKIAKDGVGAKKTGFKLEDGTEEVQNVFLTQAERCAHLDKAAGIEELLNYIQRQLLADAPEPAPKAEKTSTERPETVVDGQ